MDIRPIKTDADHRAALAEVEALWGAEEGTAQGDRLDVLATLVEAYEEERWAINTLVNLGQQDPDETRGLRQRVE